METVAVGGVHHDRIRNIYGSYYSTTEIIPGTVVADGVFQVIQSKRGQYIETIFNQDNNKTSDFRVNSSRKVPNGAHNVPRAWGSLACVYLGS